MDQEWTYFNLAQITLYELSDEDAEQIDPQNWPYTVEIQEEEGKSFIVANIEYIDTPHFNDGHSALCEHVDGCGWENVFENFKPTLVNYFNQQKDVTPIADWSGAITCIVGIETTFSKSYLYDAGCYEYDSHAWITGIIDTSTWNAESFAYTTKHPDWVESK